MSEPKKWPYTGPLAKDVAIKIKHMVLLKKGQSMQIGTEVGELIVELEAVSKFAGRAIIGITALSEANASGGGQSNVAGSIASQLQLAGHVLADRLRQRLYAPSAN